MRVTFRTAPPIWSGLAGVVTLCSLLCLWPRQPLTGTQEGDYLLFLALIAWAMIVTEGALNRGLLLPAAGLRRPGRGKFRPAYPLEKAVAAMAGLAGAVGVTQLADMYRAPPFDFAAALLLGYWPLIAVLILGYVLVVDALMEAPADALYHAGRIILSLGRSGDRAEARKMLLALVIKVFFLPLMLGYGLGDWTYFRTEWSGAGDFLTAYDGLYRLLFFVDVCLGTLGYALALRVLNTHIRGVETTVSGWLVCLCCYAPFWPVLQRSFFDYGDSITWVSVTGPAGWACHLWGGAILLCLVVYVAATASFGLNFSNLSRRTIIRHGPYGWVRHPAYWAKNTSMWLIQVPFLALSPGEAIMNTASLLGVNGLYALRAWHEERCLSEDPQYRLYLRWLRRFGLRARAGRVVRAVSRGPARRGVRRRRDD